MNYGSIAYLNEGKLIIPEYLLRPINIDNNTNLTLLSYTTPKPDDEVEEIKKIGYRNLPKKHDILITPISFRLWPYLIRARILLQERNGAIAAVSKYLADEGLNILSADCHRAGFRYMVYSCVLECASIRENNKNFQRYDTEIKRKISKLSPKKAEKAIKRNNKIRKKNKKLKKKISKEINKKISNLNIAVEPYKENEVDSSSSILKDEFDSKVEGKQIAKEMKRFLFIPTKEEVENRMVSEVHKSSTLPFHHFKVMQGKQGNRKEYYSRYTKGAIKLPEAFHAELRKNDNVDFSNRKTTPTFGFVNVDTNAPRIRVTLTPKFEINNFRRIIIDYRRDSLDTGSSVGFVSKIAEQLTEKYNLGLENVVNRIWLNKKKTESGKVEFIAEKNCKDNTDWQEVERTIKKTIAEFNQSFQNSETIVRCTPINPYKFFISLKTSDKEFVTATKKLLFEAGKNLGITKDDFKFVWTHSTPVTDSVIEALQESNALIQIYHTTSVAKDDFTWLDGEFLAMRALNKPCARICSDKKFFENDFSKFDKDVMPYIVNFAHGDKNLSKKYLELLKELINRIDLGEPNILNRFH